MESSMSKMENCINIYYSSNTSNKVSEQLFMDENGILVECRSAYVDGFDLNTKKGG